MKNTPSNDFEEISASKLKISILGNNKLNNNNSLMSKIDLENKAQPKKVQNNLNIGNNIINTNNTNENNIPSFPTSILQKVLNKADKLEIDIINGLSINSNLKIEINALGMVQGSKRNAKEGITYFGLIDEDNSYIDTNNKEDVDFIINTNEIIDEENSNILGRHFRIRFDVNTMKYYIKDLGRGFGTFKKIVKKSKIKDSYLFNIGNNYIVCTFGVDEYYQEGMGIDDGDKTLNIKVFSEIPQTDPYFFNPKQYKKIYIGRDISCNIIVDDSLLSRVHCTLEYVDEEGWFIHDGKYDDVDKNKNKPSTNGTWLYLIEEIPIEDGLIFKNNKNAFEFHVIQQNEN